MLEMKRIHNDERGEIHTITGEEMKTPEITLLVTKKGYFRGGNTHAVHDTFVQVIEGIVEVYHRPKRKEDYAPPASAGGEGQQMDGCNLITLTKGSSSKFLIPSGCPHYVYSKTDSVIIMWGPAPDEIGTYDEDMRNFVVERNRSKNTAPQKDINR